MADLIQTIQDKLKEETWTRATISNYTQNDLKELLEIKPKIILEVKLTDLKW